MCPCATTLESETSGVLMTLGAIHRRLEASCAEVTFDAIRRADSPPSDLDSP
jgi:hypothetical protein